MEMFEDPDFVDTNLNDLIIWAKSHGVDYTQVQTAHVKYRAATKINGEVRLIAVGKTLKQCLWMAYKMLNPK
jgi:hypothetical protein